MMTEEVVVYIVGADNIPAFHKYMANQTVAMFNGEVLYYINDVLRFKFGLPCID